MGSDMWAGSRCLVGLVVRKVPEYAETGGGIYVAAVQFAAAVGAMVGGLAFDVTGSKGVLVLGCLSWLLSAVVVVWRIKPIIKISTSGAISDAV
jgi:predicted MFS family arabinose efflux permease